MAIELLMIVDVGLVVGVMDPMTPYGAYSVTIIPESPVTTWGSRSSGPGCPRGHQPVLDRLVLAAAQTGLLGGHVAEPLPLAEHRGAHGLDDRLPRLETHLPIADEGGPGGGHGGVDVGVDAIAELDLRDSEIVGGAQGRRRPSRDLGSGDPAPDPLDDGLDLVIAEHRYPLRPSSRPLWYRSSPPTSQESTIAITTASTGRSRVISVCRAELPEA